ncbi:hypothetical protein [Prevotella sp. ne3005]|uniref:hypothetical protein n=1 Tax=Prevotella sp. ne3005 TaxID=1761887 RepID=UPI001113AF16|nr:hypothetical protein [Prevotella sp. ne3005]
MLRKRGDSAVEFYNAANRLYVLHFIEVAEMGSHRVLYFLLRLADGKRGGAPDKEVGRMIVAVITQYLEEHPNELVCYCHADNDRTHAIDRIFHLWARSNQDVIDGRVTSFDGTGQHTKGWGLHFTVIHHLKCKDIAELKDYILENGDAFAASVREQIILLHKIEEKMHESDDAVC